MPTPIKHAVSHSLTLRAFAAHPAACFAGYTSARAPYFAHNSPHAASALLRQSWYTDAITGLPANEIRIPATALMGDTLTDIAGALY